MELGALSGCHQMEERSFSIRGYQFPLCARCSGILTGQIIAALLAAFISPQMWMILFVLPLALDGVTQHFGLRTSTNGLRLTTGILAGYGYLSFLIALIAKIIFK